MNLDKRPARKGTLGTSCLETTWLGEDLQQFCDVNTDKIYTTIYSPLYNIPICFVAQDIQQDLQQFCDVSSWFLSWPVSFFQNWNQFRWWMLPSARFTQTRYLPLFIHRDTSFKIPICFIAQCSINLAWSNLATDETRERNQSFSISTLQESIIRDIIGFYILEFLVCFLLFHVLYFHCLQATSSYFVTSFPKELPNWTKWDNKSYYFLCTLWPKYFMALFPLLATHRAWPKLKQ